MQQLCLFYRWLKVLFKPLFKIWIIGLSFLRQLNVERIVSSRLNPLKVYNKIVNDRATFNYLSHSLDLSSVGCGVVCPADCSLRAALLLYYSWTEQTISSLNRELCWGRSHCDSFSDGQPSGLLLPIWPLHSKEVYNLQIVYHNFGIFCCFKVLAACLSGENQTIFLAWIIISELKVCNLWLL